MPDMNRRTTLITDGAHALRQLTTRALAALLLAATAGCTGLPKGVTPVAGLDAERYLGTWYEIARLDHSFERGLSRVTATYSRRDDGGIRVLNRGYSAKKDRWSEAEGKAFFVDDNDVGHLKVSFFGPFYASYVIFRLSDDYSTAYVAGYNHDYLWLLSRSPQISIEQKQQFITTAEELGFATGTLIWVDH